MAKKPKPTFQEYYSCALGSRWETLYPALLSAPLKENRYSAFSSGLLKPYFLDQASCLAAQALDVQEGETVLDMCAAPGGKSLILATKIGETGALTANDRSSERRNRLKSVLQEYLPPEVFHRISVTGHDAAKWGLYEKNKYDRILLDAPCSSDVHILTSPVHLKKWSPARTRHLAVQEYAMLAAAFAAVKPGGVIVYSTCTVLPGENDGVVRRLVEKKKGAVSVMRETYLLGEPADFGWRIWPDKEEGLGPIYFAKLRKSPEST